jgi:hypothetical protein
MLASEGEGFSESRWRGDECDHYERQNLEDARGEHGERMRCGYWTHAELALRFRKGNFPA